MYPSSNFLEDPLTYLLAPFFLPGVSKSSSSESLFLFYFGD